MKKLLLGAMALLSFYANSQPAIEHFDANWTGSPAAPPGWIVINEFGPLNTWQRTTPGNVSQPAFDGYSAFLQNETVAPGEATPSDWLITPPVLMPPSFEINFESRLTVAGDQGSIYKIYVMPAFLTPTIGNFTSNPAYLIASYTELEINPVQTDYTYKSIPVPSNATLWPAGSSVYIALVMTGNGGDRWLIDDFGITNACPAPTDVVITTLSLTSATYAWTPTDALSYDYYITPTDVPPLATTPATGNVAFSTATVTALIPGLDYKFYVRSHCADGGISTWSGFPAEIVPVDNNIFSGKVTYDADGDGVCDANGAGIPYAEIQVSINGEAPFSVYTNEEGEYNLYTIEDGTTSLSLQVVAPGLFAPVTPLVQEVIFSETIDALSVAHCLAQPSVGNDLSVTLLPLTPAKPGLPAIYRIIAHNAGSTALDNVVLSVAFNDERLNYFDSEYANTVATEGNLTINLGTLQPFSVHNGNITFNVLIPPVNAGGENLSFTASISDSDDLTPDDNTSVLNQIIVNSYDPNDITVHEGAEIYEEQADDYLTYTIRFQNTGTADAIDIKLTNTLDELLDWNTFKPVVSSHSYTVIRTDDLLEFDYKNIHLADSNSNEPESHGYITYKIKPKAGFGIGDMVSNTASIYFDFNEAIVTNTATTKVIALAGLNDNALAIAKLYPNPVKDQLHVEVSKGELQEVTIHDVNGRLCLSANAGVIDINSLKSGVYFVKIATDAGSANYKIIKQ